MLVVVFSFTSCLLFLGYNCASKVFVVYRFYQEETGGDKYIPEKYLLP